MPGIAELAPKKIILVTSQPEGSQRGRNELRAAKQLPIEVVTFRVASPKESVDLFSETLDRVRTGRAPGYVGALAFGYQSAAFALGAKETHQDALDRLVVIGAPNVGINAELVSEETKKDTLVLVPSNPGAKSLEPDHRILAGAVNVIYDVAGPGGPRTITLEEEVNEGLKTGNGNTNLIDVVSHFVHQPLRATRVV